MSHPKFLYIDDIPTPYRLGVFRRFQEQFSGSFRLLFCAPNEEGREWDLPLDDFDAHIMPVRRFHLPGMQHAYSGKWNPDIKKRIDEFAPDVAAFSGYLHPTVQVAARRFRKRGVPYGVACETSFLQHRRNSTRMRAKKVVLRSIVRGMAFGLPCGCKAEEYLRALGAADRPMYHFPNTPDIDRVIEAGQTVRDEDARRAFLKRFDVSPDRDLVAFVGRFAQVKRPLDLLSAYEQTPQVQRDGSALIMIGAGPMAEALRERVSAMQGCTVHLLDWMDPSDVFRFLTLARAMVLPSGHEPWGAVVNESMAVGTPVIASDQVGAAHDLIDHGRTGWMYPSGDVNALSELLAEVLIPGNDLESICSGARRAARAGDAEFAAGNLRRALEVALA